MLANRRTEEGRGRCANAHVRVAPRRRAGARSGQDEVQRFVSSARAARAVWPRNDPGCTTGTWRETRTPQPFGTIDRESKGLASPAASGRRRDHAGGAAPCRDARTASGAPPGRDRSHGRGSCGHARHRPAPRPFDRKPPAWRGGPTLTRRRCPFLREPWRPRPDETPRPALPRGAPGSTTAHGSVGPA